MSNDPGTKPRMEPRPEPGKNYTMAKEKNYLFHAGEKTMNPLELIASMKGWTESTSLP